MKRFRVILYILFLGSITSCATEIVGEGGTETQTYSIGTNVTKVSVDHQINTVVKYGVYKKVHVTGYSNLLDYVKISATGGVIRIGMKPDYTYQNMNITAVVEMPALTGVAATHQGDATIEPFDDAIPTLELTTSGTGDINCSNNLKVGDLSANMSNEGIIVVYGLANTVTINQMGSGTFYGINMFANSATVTNSGTGDIIVNPKTELNATILSSGNIYYKRYPIITSTITGTGQIIDAN